jgi:hypothetical protein
MGYGRKNVSKNLFRFVLRITSLLLQMPGLIMSLFVVHRGTHVADMLTTSCEGEASAP